MRGRRREVMMVQNENEMTLPVTKPMAHGLIIILGL